MAAIISLLEAWLADRQSLSFDPGTADCCIVLADWVSANGYPDGAVHLRGTYSTEDQMRQLIIEAGGALELVGRCADIAGLNEVQTRKTGDIGVIGSLHSPLRQWGAIWDGEHWQVHWNSGFEAIHAPVLKIWSV